MEPTDVIVRSLRGCLVQVKGETQTGSGFFAAPGLVVTCAHVVGRKRVVTLRQGAAAWEGKVVFASPLGTSTVAPYPDLAIIETSSDIESSRCVWWDQRLPSPGSPLHAVGFSKIYGGELRQSSASPTFDGTYDFDGEMLVLGGREIAAGMSGGPVLNLKTGGVCGVTKVSRQQDSDRGGLAIPIWALRSADPELYRRLIRGQDRYFGVEREWSTAADALTRTRPHEILPVELRQLRALLAETEVPSDHAGRFMRAAGRECLPPARDLVDASDVVTDLSGQVAPSAGELPYVLRYAADLAAGMSGREGQAVRDWTLLTAGRLRLGKAAVARLNGAAAFTQPSSLMVRLRPTGAAHDRFAVTIWRYFNEATIIPLPLDTEPLTLPQAIRLIRDELPRQLTAMAPDCTEIMVEMFLPQQLLELDVETWNLWPDDKPWSAVGRTHAVIVRDQSRLEDMRGAPAWQKRWERGAHADLGARIESVPCSDDRSHEAVEGWLEGDHRRSALAFASSPLRSGGRSALEVGVPAGVPVMIWRRGYCADCPGGACPGEDFVERLRGALAGVSMTELPERVRKLRSDAAAGDRLADDLVLLYDDPGRRPPHDRLVRPEERMS
ncbi:hypothetical protein Cs7R123_49320 [Catellatospora sp. TT07R-123]|uniref:VMAP-C domain-containing protein n=1 Tax=Catellatospora sp. TT07R-123 TaxID=2733863 RepID=UPI001B1078FD|nr:trypsin-like peptidase domain-containing protein [Catellatospora sp. TT07R-123]GHJ47590.1 hypothetical protein Cs7R123_49320 [Catellatospora sp. TT07R-123]